jgi:hypothetical protein
MKFGIGVFWGLSDKSNFGPQIKNKTKLRVLSPRTNYTNRATAACRQKLVPPIADKGCHVASATDPHDRILGLLDRSRYYFFQANPQLSGPRTRTSGSTAWNYDH